jgi:hypothetical protein
MTAETPRPDADSLSCTQCGAALPPGADWCAACAVFARPDALIAQVRADERANRVVPVFSRTKGGVLSFGLKGRLACTAAVLGVFWWLLTTAFPFAIIWFVIAVPYGLRDIWKRTRIR